MLRIPLQKSGLTLAGALFCSQAALATTNFVSVTFDRSAWEAEAGSISTSETFDNDIAQSDTLTFDSGIQSEAAGDNAAANHLVTAGRFNGTLRTSIATAAGYLTFTWTFPENVTAFGADFYSIGGSRQVSVQGTFDSGLEAFDLRTLFGNDGGVDQGFFGLISDTPFNSITLVALNSAFSGNDNFTVDNVALVQAIPEPASLTLVALGIAGLGMALRRPRAES